MVSPAFTALGCKSAVFRSHGLASLPSPLADPVRATWKPGLEPALPVLQLGIGVPPLPPLEVPPLPPPPLAAVAPLPPAPPPDFAAPSSPPPPQAMQASAATNAQRA